ncbi:MAG: DUF4355 domain-containing protein [Eubacteriales bacterium]|nr:DUF4355 domain-containing protein [Eubacteriales bacterium]
MEENKELETNENVEVKENSTEIAQENNSNTQFDAESFRKQIFEEFRAEMQKEREEFEKTKNMKADEKAKYNFEKRVKENDERESQLFKRELRLDAHNILIEKGLNPKLLDILDYSSKENCENSINTVENVFRECVQQAVNEKLKGSTPLKASNSGSNVEDIIKKAMGIQ